MLELVVEQSVTDTCNKIVTFQADLYFVKRAIVTKFFECHMV